jgi:hypothetical protein
MKIELEEPFKSLWNGGYLIEGSKSAGTGRKMVVLHNNSKDRTTISYARYLWIINNGDISSSLEVDHINNDRTDDRLENLQLLTKGENLDKAKRSTTYIDKKCEWCNNPFKVRAGNDKTKTCGRSCGGKLSHKTRLYFIRKRCEE